VCKHTCMRCLVPICIKPVRRSFQLTAVHQKCWSPTLGTKQAHGCARGRAGFYVMLTHSGASGWENCPSPSSSVQKPPANQLKGHTDPTQADCRTSLGAEGAEIFSVTNSLSSSTALPSFLTPKGMSSAARKGLLNSLLHLRTGKMGLETPLFKLPIA